MESEAVGSGGVRGDKWRGHKAPHEVELLGPLRAWCLSKVPAELGHREPDEPTRQGSWAWRRRGPKSLRPLPISVYSSFPLPSKAIRFSATMLNLSKIHP